MAVTVVIAVIGGGWYYHDRTKLNGLQCEIVDTETQYSSSGEKTVKVKAPVTWLVELSDNQWRLVSLDGTPMTEMSYNKEHKEWILPLRTTAEAYVLIEKNDRTSENYDYTNSPTIIDRVTGALIGEEHTYDRTTHWSMATEGKGHCVPIHIGATL
jgi:hypothetical protein